MAHDTASALPEPYIPSDKSANAFQQLILDHPLPMWVYDLRTLFFLEVNHAAIKKYGYSREEFLAMTLKEIRPAEELDRFLNDIVQLRMLSSSESGEWRHRLRDGSIIDVEITSHTIDYEGHAAALVLAYEVTGRKQAELLKQRSEEEYRNLFDNANDAIIIFEPESEIILQANKRACDLYGFNLHELLGKSLKTLTKDVSKGEQQIAKLLDDGSYLGFETVQLNKAGDEIYILVNSSVIEYEGKKAVLSMNRDFTDRKRVELLLKESESSYRGLFNSVSDAITIHDAETRFIDVNDGTLKMFGYSRDEIVGQMPELLSAPNKNNAAELMAIFDKAFNGEPQQFEYWGKRKNGEIFPIEVRLTKSRYFGKDVIVALSQDVTARKNSEQMLRDVQRRESIGILSSGIAHDFNNLLAAMMGNISIAQSRMQPDHPAVLNLEKAIAAMEHAAHLTKQMLAFSGKGQYEVRTIDLGKLIRDHISLLEISLPKNVKLQTALQSDPICIQGDPTQIEQIIMNLIINGGDAVGEKQGVVAVRLASVTMTAADLRQYSTLTNTRLHEGAYALIEVTDTGIGMSRETMNKIFDPFFTTKFTGRGLGLSAVLGIIQGHKGGIIVESEEGRGTTFRLILPSIAAEAVKEAPRVDDDDHTLSAPAVSTILVIDDEEEVATMAKEMLEEGEYTVLVAVNPIQGIELFTQQKSEIRAVLLDLTMPEMSGKEVMDALQKINPDVKVIISSGYSEEEVTKQIGAAKVSAFIQKPYRFQSLLAMVHSVIR